jgi:hypothetical protein
MLKSTLNYDYDLQIMIHHRSLILLRAIINLKQSTQITSTRITPQLGNIIILYAIAKKEHLPCSPYHMKLLISDISQHARI